VNENAVASARGASSAKRTKAAPVRLLGLVRSWVGAARHFPERVRHSQNRAEARDELAHARINSVLFICHGNICRSPFAAALFDQRIRALLPVQMLVRSAGFIGPGRQSPPLALSTASHHGLDLTPHRSVLVNQTIVDTSDLIVVMDPAQSMGLRRRFRIGNARILVLGDLDPQPIRRRTIRDPWGCDEKVFADSYSRIERCIDELVTLLTGQSAAASQRGVAT
jgi:protein-tyrosine-phosphatase